MALLWLRCHGRASVCLLCTVCPQRTSACSSLIGRLVVNTLQLCLLMNNAYLFCSLKFIATYWPPTCRLIVLVQYVSHIVCVLRNCFPQGNTHLLCGACGMTHLTRASLSTLSVSHCLFPLSLSLSTGGI
jgi:hypothetical protein